MSDDSMYTEIFDEDGNLHPVLRDQYLRGAQWNGGYGPWMDYSTHTYGSFDSWYDAMVEIREIEHGERRVTRCAWTLSHPDAQEYDFAQLEATPQARRALQITATTALHEEAEEKRKRDALGPQSPRSYKPRGPSPAILHEREMILANAVAYQDQQESDRVHLIVELMCMAQGCLQLGNAHFGLLRWTDPEGHWGKKHPVLLQYQNKWFCEAHIKEITVGLLNAGLPSHTRLFLVSRSFPVRRKELKTL